MNEKFVLYFAIGIVSWIIFDLFVEYLVERHENKKRLNFEEKVNRYRRGRK